jgi:hypothetical protein
VFLSGRFVWPTEPSPRHAAPRRRSTGVATKDRAARKEQLWHRLDNESGRAYEAFEVYMCLPPAERSMVRAWREWSGNPEAKGEPPF